MRVIKSPVTTFTWSFKCPNCTGECEADASDLHHHPGSSDGREVYPERFSVNCGACSQGVTVPSDIIPALVKKAAKERGR